jgi:hypothetical protein
MPDDHYQAADDDAAAYHCAPDHHERVRVAAAPHGRPHARNNDRAGGGDVVAAAPGDVAAAAPGDDCTASDHIRAGDDGPAPGYDDGPGPGHDDAATRDYRRTGNQASP